MDTVSVGASTTYALARLDTLPYPSGVARERRPADSIVGRNIQAAMAAHVPPMSPSDVARKLGVVPQWVNDKVLRWDKIDLANLLRIAWALDVDVNVLVRGLNVDYDQVAKEKSGGRDLLRPAGAVEFSLTTGRVHGPTTGPQWDTPERLNAELESLAGRYRALTFSIGQHGTGGSKTGGGSDGSPHLVAPHKGRRKGGRRG